MHIPLSPPLCNCSLICCDVNNKLHSLSEINSFLTLVLWSMVLWLNTALLYPIPLDAFRYHGHYSGVISATRRISFWRRLVVFYLMITGSHTRGPLLSFGRLLQSPRDNSGILRAETQATFVIRIVFFEKLKISRVFTRTPTWFYSLLTYLVQR